MLNAIKAFIKAADDFKDNRDVVPVDTSGLIGSSIIGAGGAAACLALTVGCMIGAAVGTIFIVGGQALNFKNRMDKVKAARLKGQESFMFLFDR